MSYPTKSELVKHMKYSSNVGCQSHYQQCPFCGKGFETKKSLLHHQRMSNFCLNQIDTPEALNIVGFSNTHTNASSTITSSGNERYVNDINICQPIVASRISQHTSELQLDPYRVPKKRDQTNKAHQLELNEFKQFMKVREQIQNDVAGYVKNFSKMCDRHDMRLSLDLNGILNSELTKRNQLIAELTRKSQFTLSSVMSSMTKIRMEILNISGISVLDNSIQFMPGFESNLVPLMADDIDQFIARYAQVYIPKELPSLSLPPPNITQNSLVYDVQWTHSPSGSFEEVIDNTDNVHVHYEEMEFGTNDSDESDDGLLEHDHGREQMAQQEVVSDEFVDTCMKAHKECIDNSRISSVYDANDIANIELYQLLKQSGAPAYLFDKIQDWGIQHANNLIGSNGQNLQRRATFVKNMSQKVYGREFSKAMSPKIETLHLPSGNVIDVVTCSIKEQIVSLLTNYKLMKPDNLLLNPHNPFAEPNNTNLGEIDTGWWWRETKAEICRNGTNHILLPLVFFIDGSNIDKNGRLQVEPVTFTLGIFKRKLRNVAEAWRTIGYIEDIKNSKEFDPTSNPTGEQKTQDYHAILDVIFRDLKGLQGKDGGFHWTLELNQVKFDVVFKVATQLIIGDCKGNDKLCGRYGSHHKNISHLCRDCDVLTEDGDDPFHICKMLKREDVIGKPKKEMKSISFHGIQNAFTDIYFGARSLCVSEVTPPEPLHGFKLGLCKYLFEGLELQVASKTMRLINKACIRIAKHSNHQSVKNLPSLNPFKRGVSKCNSLSADEQYARVFLLYLAFTIPEVLRSVACQERKVKDVILDEDGNEKLYFRKIDPIGEEKAKEWFRLISKTICFKSWIMSPEHHPTTVNDKPLQPLNRNVLHQDSDAQHKIRDYLQLFKDVVDREKGNGLCLPKFHQALHYVAGIKKDGSLLNVDGGRCESIGKTNHTNPAKRTQMRTETLLPQLSECYHSDLIIEEAANNWMVPYGKLLGVSLSNTIVEPIMIPEQGTIYSFEGSRYKISYDNGIGNRDIDRGEISIQWEGIDAFQPFDTDLLRSLGDRLYIRQRTRINRLTHTSVVHGSTEYHKNGCIFRAHPSFRSSEPWFDWAYVRWEGQRSPVPAKIHMFLDFRSCQFDITPNDGDLDEEDGPDIEDCFIHNDLYVVVESAFHPGEDPTIIRDRYRVHDDVSSRVRLDGKWRILPIECIASPAFAVPAEISQRSKINNDYTVLVPEQKWYSLFLHRE